MKFKIPKRSNVDLTARRAICLLPYNWYRTGTYRTSAMAYIDGIFCPDGADDRSIAIIREETEIYFPHDCNDWTYSNESDKI